MAQVGIAGIGRMGAAIGARLIEGGHTLTVWNRTVDKTRALAEAGAAVAPTPAALAGAAEIVITMLTDADALAAVYEGAEGLLTAALDGRLVIDMSTVRPEATQALAARVIAAGAGFVECPVGGTVGPARQGKLLGLAGGTEADVARARPLLDQLCRRVEHVGAVGAGASMKLAINLPLLVFYQALGEAMVLCDHLGHDKAWLMELFADTSGGPNVLKTRGPAIAKALAGEDAGPPAFDIDSIRKDLRTMAAEAAARGSTLPLVRQTLAIYDDAAAAGWGARDGANLPAFWPGRGSR